MKNRLIAICSLAVLACFVYCFGHPIPFTPLVRNYTAVEYNAASQNWAVAQDKRGIMYFGNNNGLLEFDGNQWCLHPILNGKIARCLYISEDEKIYVGSYEEFGYFIRDELNRLKYYSLKPEVKDFKFHNDEIWNIIEVEGRIVFQSFASYFIVEGEHVSGHKRRDLPFYYSNKGYFCRILLIGLLPNIPFIFKSIERT